MKKENLAFREYITKALNGMALGLFSSLIIGLILKQVGDYAGLEALVKFGKMAQFVMGPAIGAGVAFSIGAPPLGIFACIVTGAIGAGTIASSEGGTFIVKIGEPVGAFVAALVGAEFSKFISGKTKVDIVLVPAATIIIGGLAGIFIGPIMASVMKTLGGIINRATELRPIPMGIIISVLMGMILTLPISSAALSISLGLNGLAAGASVVGCATQMIGFAVASYRENGIGGAIAQGLGTSMLQVPNIIKNPFIWIPPTLASAILGPIATYVLKMENNSIGAGMGTSGLVGQFGTIAAMGGSQSTTIIIGKIALLHFILPALLTFIISEYMRKKGWIKYGDMKLNP
ncbi:PTS sugar transporter subunit IIC [Crassaminicella thermophila]|uniref:PTS sugar transporter subunit IIC n=1 Tax=Crassaminicella thermophila TaxID=2599308 RepID=A0A5C0SCI9_CRATE|nr:PTS sugar transporter subunit IIC [Crassaminicella thermophila]QEK10914.1 PTS sugar transporter subunit IIC [Crassaminicella thermophila]